MHSVLQAFEVSKKVGNKYAPRYEKLGLPWYERDGLLWYIGQLKYKEFVDNLDEYFFFLMLK